jgi:rhodanese-related sulfurtransferase
VPHDQLLARLTELPVKGDVVAYCRSRYCVFAPEAVRLMRDHGYVARLLDGGLPEWRRGALPIDAEQMSA